MTKKKRARKERRQSMNPTPRRGRPGTLGELMPEIREMERATGNPVRVWEMPDGSITLDYSTPRDIGKRPA